MNKNRKIKRVLTAGLAVGMSAVLCPLQVFAAERDSLRLAEKRWQ